MIKTRSKPQFQGSFYNEFIDLKSFIVICQRCDGCVDGCVFKCYFFVCLNFDDFIVCVRVIGVFIIEMHFVIGFW